MPLLRSTDIVTNSKEFLPTKTSLHNAHFPWKMEIYNNRKLYSGKGGGLVGRGWGEPGVEEGEGGG